MTAGVAASQRRDHGAPGKVIRWIRRRRPFLTAIFVAAVLVLAWYGPAMPSDLIHPRLDPAFLLPWVLMIAGVGIRVWGSGNLRKNQEITSTGIYRMVRHPLYSGSLAMFLALFITVGDPLLGAVLFTAMVVLVYYPTMLDEEAYLQNKFPHQTAAYARLPRLIPSLRRLPEALRTDRFTLQAAYGNLGLRSVGFLVALPSLLELLRWLKGSR